MSEQYPPFNPDLYSTPLQQNPYYQHLSQEQLPRMRQAPIPTDGMINQEFPVTKREAPAHIPLSQTKEASEEDEYVEEDPTFTYNGFQVVRGEYFAHLNEPSITIANSQIYVNSACIRKAPDVDFVQVLVNSEERKLVVRPSTEDIKDSFSWKTSKGAPKHITCRMFYAMLMDLMGWNPEYRYKIIGKRIKNENEYIFLFNLTNTQIYMRTVIFNENGVAKKMTSRKPVYPDSWKNQFGLPVEEHKQAISINKIDDYIVIGIQDPKKKHAASETTTE